jgi:hypothetical protein
MSATTDDIILNLRRELAFRSRDGVQRGELHIERISYFPERRCWGCFWSISFIRPSLRQPIYGEDALQALTLSLRTIAELVRDSGLPDVQIWWTSEGDNGGFSALPAATPIV